jgi:hypothetical protein
MNIIESHNLTYINNYINLSININKNLDNIIEIPNIKNIINNSEDIIHKYSMIWSELDYNHVISCYIALLYCIYSNFTTI